MNTTKGVARRGMSDALIIPLALEYHSLDGNGIDANMGVLAWEERFGEQAAFLDEVGLEVGYDLWEYHALLTNQTFRAPSGNI